MKTKITKLIMSVGVPTNIRGYDYIREAIMLCYNDRSYLRGITKALYPEIAKTFSTTPSRVERAIRHAIHCSWSESANEFCRLLGDIDIAPTNSVFISTLLEHLLLEESENISENSDPFLTYYGRLPSTGDNGENEEMSPEIALLKEHIVDLRVSSIDASIPRGHCHYAYYNIDNSDSECSTEELDCDKCRNQFIKKVKDLIRREVFSKDYLK